MFFLYFLFAHILLFLSNLPLILRVGLSFGKKIFPLIHIDWPHDYFLYLSVIKQGMNAVLLTHDAFTVEKIPPDFIYFIYNLVGFISIPFHLPSFIVYHLFRIVTLELFFFSVYLLTKYLFQKRWILPALLVLILPLTPFGLMKSFLGVPFLSAGFEWWVYFEALERLNSLPHYLLAQSFLILAIYFLLKFQAEEQSSLPLQTISSAKVDKYWLLSFLFIGLGVFILPSLSIVVLISIPLYLLLTLKKFISFIPIGFLVLAISVLFKFQTSFGMRKVMYESWLYERWNLGEVNFNNVGLLIFAFPAILAFFSFLKMFKKGYGQFLIFPFWLLTPVILSPFVDFLRFPKIHLLASNLFIPFAILIGLFILEGIDHIKYRLFSIVLVFIILFVAISNNFQILRQRIVKVSHENLTEDHYIEKDEYTAYKYIDINIPKESVFICRLRVCGALPAFAMVRSYFGHINQTIDFIKKENAANIFFSLSKTEDEAKIFLKESGVNYVYYGPDEKRLKNGKNMYSFLKRVYTNKLVDIYAVN